MGLRSWNGRVSHVLCLGQSAKFLYFCVSRKIMDGLAANELVQVLTHLCWWCSLNISQLSVWSRWHLDSPRTLTMISLDWCPKVQRGTGSGVQVTPVQSPMLLRKKKISSLAIKLDADHLETLRAILQVWLTTSLISLIISIIQSKKSLVRYQKNNGNKGKFNKTYMNYHMNLQKNQSETKPNPNNGKPLKNNN